MTAMEISQVLGNIGELVAAVAVVVSLVYVAVQVRDNSRLISENTKAQQMAAEVSSNDGNRALNLELIKNPELLNFVQRGMGDLEMDEMDAQRFALWLRMVMESHMTYFVQNKRGLSGSEVWEYWSHFFDRFCTRPGVVHVWQRMRNDFDESFRSYIDAKITSD